MWWYQQELSQSACPWCPAFYKSPLCLSGHCPLSAVSTCHSLRWAWWPGECVISAVAVRSALAAHFLFRVRFQAMTRCSKYCQSGFRYHRSLGARAATAQRNQRSEVKRECYWLTVYEIELDLTLAMIWILKLEKKKWDFDLGEVISLNICCHFKLFYIYLNHQMCSCLERLNNNENWSYLYYIVFTK